MCAYFTLVSLSFELETLMAKKKSQRFRNRHFPPTSCMSFMFLSLWLVRVKTEADLPGVNTHPHSPGCQHLAPESLIYSKQVSQILFPRLLYLCSSQLAVFSIGLRDGLWNPMELMRIPALLLPSCVTLDNLPNRSEPWFPCL